MRKPQRLYEHSRRRHRHTQGLGAGDHCQDSSTINFMAWRPPPNLGALQLIFMCSKDSVGTGYSTQLQAKLKQEQIDKHHCFSQHMHLYGQGICIGYSKCCQSGSYYSKEWMQPNINMEPSPFLWLLVETSVLSPKWLRRSNMWCDRRPGSQPSISAETAWLICRAGGCGVWGEDDIDGIIYMSAKLQAR